MDLGSVKSGAASTRPGREAITGNQSRDVFIVQAADEGQAVSFANRPADTRITSLLRPMSPFRNQKNHSGPQGRRGSDAIRPRPGNLAPPRCRSSIFFTGWHRVKTAIALSLVSMIDSRNEAIWHGRRVNQEFGQQAGRVAGPRPRVRSGGPEAQVNRIFRGIDLSHIASVSNRGRLETSHRREREKPQ